MKFEELESRWAIDSEISGNLFEESIKTPKLHAKWYSILNSERKLFYKIDKMLTEMEVVLDSYYSRTISFEDLQKHELGDLPDRTALKTDIPKLIAVHPKIIDLKIAKGQQLNKISYLEDIIKCIHARPFILRDAIEWRKFEAGN